MYNILVIEDEKLVSDMLQKVITRLGYNVQTASGGQEGLQMFEKAPFDLVITNIRMPGIDGHSVARHIRNSDKPRTPIIGITASPWLLDGNEFDTFIFDYFIPKPFHIQALSDAITEVTSNASNSYNSDIE
jgi:CheY-like chemotaxis protein